MADESKHISESTGGHPDPKRVPPVSSSRSRRGTWRWIGGILLVLLLAGGALAWLYQAWLIRPTLITAPQTIIIMKESSLNFVARRLEERKLIPSALALRVYARMTKRDTRLKVGEYEVSGRMSPIQILELLNSGRVKSFWVTIPEGKWVSEIASYLQPNWPDAAARFPEAVRDAKHWSAMVKFPLEGNSLEGYLFPSTYLVNKDAGVEQIITAMLKGFETNCWVPYTKRDLSDSRSLREILILASLVEAEAKRKPEQPVIAGVYVNRLAKGMPLQCDATVLYAHRQRMTRVLFRDLEIDSPYNTYRYPGLPAGPICNPGQGAFLAALRPAKSDYLYYVARGDGSHVFTRTLADHQAAIRQIRGR